MKYFKGVLSSVFILILLFYYCVISFDINDSKKIVSNVDDVIDIGMVEEKLKINKVEELRNYYGNSDIKGIISIDNLDGFNYPVVQTDNNDYYLNHNYYRDYDIYGSIYADYRIDLDNSRKKLIFGHSSVKRKVPFNELESYYDEDYYKEHKYITLETETEIYRYEIFSVYVEISDFTYMNINFNSEEDWYRHILGLQKKSIYDIDVDLNSDDEVLILQTCSTNSEYYNYSKKYLLIVSRRVK